MVSNSSVFERPSLEQQQPTSWWNFSWRKMAEAMYDDLRELISSLTNAQQAPVKKNTMAACKVRFSGQYDREAVSEFIAAIETFKSLEEIEDADALKGISLLFTGTASMWWQGIRREAETWQDCLRLIREHFAPHKAPHQIYMELFNTKQDSKTGIDYFIVQKRALLAQLPHGRHDEQCQLDLIYGLIHFKYRQFVKRNEIKTFQDVLQKARDIEQNDVEAANEDKTTKPKRCSYCNYRGHTTEECRRRQQKDQKAAETAKKQ